MIDQVSGSTGVGVGGAIGSPTRFVSMNHQQIKKQGLRHFFTICSNSIHTGCIKDRLSYRVFDEYYRYESFKETVLTKLLEIKGEVQVYRKSNFPKRLP